MKRKIKTNFTSFDRVLLDGYAALLPGIVTLFGPNCVASLHSAEDESFPCVAVENGAIVGMKIAMPMPEFAADAVSDEAHHGGKNTIGLYYSKTADDHALKCVVNLIRNPGHDLIGCLCISIDVSVPLHEFIRNFIPVVDNDLAESIAEPLTSNIENIDQLIYRSIAQAMEEANSCRGLSATDRNRLVVQQLQNSSIFNIRGAVNIVAKELGVSRYTVYNYLKDSPPSN